MGGFVQAPAPVSVGTSSKIKPRRLSVISQTDSERFLSIAVLLLLADKVSTSQQIRPVKTEEWPRRRRGE